MIVRRQGPLAGLALLAGFAAGPVNAQIPVTDVGAILQLVSQLQVLEQQLQTARQVLQQAQSEYESITGGRGMNRLLAGTVRNYLPGNWADVQGAAQGNGGAFPVLAGEMQAAIGHNSALSDAQLLLLSAPDQRILQAQRQSAAVQQVLAQQALTVTSERFIALQQLIDAIADTSDQKSILELQARTAAEQSMLQNEKTKLDLLRQSALADEAANRARTREQVLASHGDFASRFQPAP